MKKIIVLISGGGSNLEAIAKACQTGNIPASIELVISNQAHVKGLERAKKFHLMSKVIEHKNFNSREEFDKALLEQILPIEPDLVVLAGFMRILTADFVNHYANKLLNIHPSLLPQFKGLNTHQRAIDAKASEHGATVHFVTAELDDGPIVLQAKVPVLADDDAQTLAKRVLIQEHQLYPNAIKKIIQERAL